MRILQVCKKFPYPVMDGEAVAVRALALGLREAGCAEYLHPWGELVGGLCRAGFVVEDLTEPDHADPRAPAGTAGHRARFLPPYVRIKARRVERAEPSSPIIIY